jgi:hypothetical protein
MTTWQENLDYLALIQGENLQHLKTIATGLSKSAGRYRDDHRPGQPWKTAPYVYITQIYEMTEYINLPFHTYVCPGHGMAQSCNPLCIVGEDVHISRSSYRTLSEKDSAVLTRGMLLETRAYSDDIDRIFALPMDLFIQKLAS